LDLDDLLGGGSSTLPTQPQPQQNPILALSDIFGASSIPPQNATVNNPVQSLCGNINPTIPNINQPGIINFLIYMLIKKKKII
jgi:hypothetical protein